MHNINYTRQKAHVNMLNIADICGVLCSRTRAGRHNYNTNYTRQKAHVNKTNYTRQKAFHSEGGAGVNGISAKIETYRVTKVKICLVKYEDYEETFFLPPNVGDAVLVCLTSLFDRGLRLVKKKTRV